MGGHHIGDCCFGVVPLPSVISPRDGASESIRRPNSLRVAEIIMCGRIEGVTDFAAV